MLALQHGAGRSTPALFDHSYAPLIAAGAELVPAPEIAESAMREFASRHRLLLLTAGWNTPGSADSDFVELPIQGDPVVSELYVVRRSGVHSRAVDAFWQLVSDDRSQAALQSI
jgi:hypothetical protein